MGINFWLYIAIFAVLFVIIQKALSHSNPAAGGAAKKIRGQLEELYANPHEFREVTPQEFPHINPEHYDVCERWLATQGFKKAADLEDLTLSRVYPNTRTFLRVFLSKDGSIVAACYDINPKGWMKLLQWVHLMPQRFRTLDFETEFVNGAFLRTSNSLGKQLLDEPPAISQNLFSDDTPFEELLAFHRDTMADWRQIDEGFAPRLCTNLDDLIAMQYREQEITSAWRKEIGYVTSEEMKRMAGKSGQGQKNAEQVMQEIQRINEKKRPGPPPTPGA